MAVNHPEMNVRIFVQDKLHVDRNPEPRTCASWHLVAKKHVKSKDTCAANDAVVQKGMVRRRQKHLQVAELVRNGGIPVNIPRHQPLRCLLRS